MGLKIVRKADATKPKTGAKAEKVKGKAAAANAGRNTGRTSGLGVAKFQNQSIESNRKRKLTDEQLVKEWKAEFPNAKADYTVETVRGVRNLFNKGKHDNDKPGTPIPEYNDAGEAQPFWGERAAAKKVAAKSTKGTPAKKAKIVIRKGKK